MATRGRDLSTEEGTRAAAAVDLYWLPVGAGDGPLFPLSCRVYEALVARIERRPACDLYHSALQVHLPEGKFVIEQAPVPDLNGDERGVVAEGAVGRRWARRFRICRCSSWHAPAPALVGVHGADGRRQPLPAAAQVFTALVITVNTAAERPFPFLTHDLLARSGEPPAGCSPSPRTTRPAVHPATWLGGAACLHRPVAA